MHAPNTALRSVLLWGALLAPASGCLALKVDQDEIGQEVAKLRKEVAMSQETLTRASTLSDELEKKLAAADLQAWIDGASETLVDLQLPRFTLAHSVDLEPVLDRLGLEDLFKPRRANLSGISEVKLALSAALHRTFVAVDEKGTEAAAATAITLKIESADRATPFVVDRPFLFLIRDTRSGLFLFLGRFSDPVTGTPS